MLFEIANVHETWVLMVAIYNVDFELRLTKFTRFEENSYVEINI